MVSGLSQSSIDPYITSMAAKLHRKELKHDEIREKMTDAVKSLSLHGREVIYIVGLVIAVGLIAFAWFHYENKQQEESQNLLGIALEKFGSPVGQQASVDSPTKPTYSYKTDSEKYSDALKDFEKVARQYGNTPASDMARYYAGVCAFYLGDFSKAEQYLVQSSRVSDRNILFYRSRSALADLYLATGKPDKAIQVLKEASERNKRNIVPAETLLMQLAESYEKAGLSKEATQTYQKILKDYKDSPVSYQAQIRLNEMKSK